MDIKLLLENFTVVLILPFVLTLFIYILMRLFQIHPWRRVHLTAQWSALLYVAGVVLIVEEMYHQFILSYILIAFLLFLAIHITIQWRKQITISLIKAIVLLLRIVFLLFFITYITLVTIYGIRIFA